MEPSAETDGCPSEAQLVHLASDEIADPLGRTRLEVHVAACPLCGARLREIRANQRLLAFIKRVEPPTVDLSQAGALRPGASSEPAASADHAAEASLAANPAAPNDKAPWRGYRLLELLHRGGQGAIHRALHEPTGRAAAMKVIRAGTSRERQRLWREAQLVAKLRHPNIVTVHDCGLLPGGGFAIAMELVEGVTLDEWRRRIDAEDLSAGDRVRRKLALFVKVCDAVQHAHQRGVIHRDLKPSNILVDASDEPRILDFGIAHDTTGVEPTITRTGEFTGTLAYAAPEQVSSDAQETDTRSDVYSLGVVLYELVAGTMPYDTAGPMESVVNAIAHAEPIPPRTDIFDRRVDADVTTIILKALSKAPDRRYQSAGALGADIARHLAGTAIEARRDSTWYVLRKTASRHRVAFAAAGVIVAILAGFGAAMAWQARRLAVRGRELASALSDSNVERGRLLAAAGNVVQAEAVVWPELIGAGVTRIDGPEVGFVGSTGAMHAYWALWDMFRKSARVATLRTGGRMANPLRFDKDGRRLSAFDGDGRLVSWSTATWERLRDTSLVAPVDKVKFRAAMSPNGDIAIFGGGMLRVIDPETGGVRAQVADPDDQAVAGTFGPDGAVLATIGRDGRLRLWDAGSLASLVTIAGESVCKDADDCSLPAFSLDGSRVAAALADGALGVWNATSGALERTLRPPQSLERDGRVIGFPRRIAFGSDGTIAASLVAHVVVWPAGNERPLDLGGQFGAGGATVAFVHGPECELLVASGGAPGGGSGVTLIWKPLTGERVATFKHLTVSSTCTASPDGRFIAVGGFEGGRGTLEGMVQVFEATEEPSFSVLHEEAGRGAVAAMSRDGTTVALAAAHPDRSGQDVLVMDLKSGTTTNRFHREGSPLSKLAFAPDGLSLFEGQWNGRITQAELPAGTTRCEFVVPDASGSDEPTPAPGAADQDQTMDANQMRLSPQGNVIARAGPRGQIDLWEVPSGRWIGALAGGGDADVFPSAVIEFSPDGATLAVRASNKCVLWDVRARTIQRSMPMGGWGWMRFSPDGSVLASGVYGSIIFFDVHTGRVLSENKDPGSAGTAVVFHPGGNLFFASSSSNSIRAWDVRTGRELFSLPQRASLIGGSLFVTPDGKSLISSDASGAVVAWDLTYYNGHIRRELEFRAAH